MNYIAVDVDSVLAQLAHVQRGAKGTADQSLDFERSAPLLASAGFSLVTVTRRTRQHAVFGSQPTLTLPFQEARHAILNAGGADHFGVTELHQYRTFGVLGVVARDADGTQLIGGAATGSLHEACPAYGEMNDAIIEGLSDATTTTGRNGQYITLRGPSSDTQAGKRRAQCS